MAGRVGSLKYRYPPVCLAKANDRWPAFQSSYVTYERETIVREYNVRDNTEE